MDEFHACTIKNAHQANCDDTETCWGCQPAQASIGLLCTYCAERLTMVLSQWGSFVTALTGVDRAFTPETEGSVRQPGSTVNLTPIWLAIDEVKSSMAGFTGDAVKWVSTVLGAEASQRFVRVAQSAFRAVPIEERSHRIRQVRCQACGQNGLQWRPPQFFLDNVHVTCAKCDADYDQATFDRMVLIAETNQVAS
jgi:hypothetical protein